MGTTHTGAHIDAHAHMTIGAEDRWHGGSARTDLGDFGPLQGDATEIPPLWRRGVLYDVPGHRGVESLPAGEPVERRRAARRSRRAHGVPRPAPATWRSCAPATSRTGPTPRRSPRTAAPAPTCRRRGCSPSAACVATGSDTETYEVQPAPDRGSPANPQPVHTLLLIERGIYILESLDLEALARARRARVPVRGAAAGDPRRDRLDGRPGGDRVRALVVARAERVRACRTSSGPRPGRARGALPGARDRDLRHRPAHHPGPLPGLLAARTWPLIPGHEWCGDVVELGPGRGRLRLGGRHARGGHVARRLRLLPQAASRAGTTSASASATCACTAVRPLRRRARTPTTSCTRSRACSRCPTRCRTRRRRCSTRPRSRCTRSSAAAMRRATRSWSSGRA